MKITAPFSPEQIKALNYFQWSGVFHPFTCANQGDEAHNGRQVELVATKAGWICPYCDYTQDWAHALMADYEKIKAQVALRETSTLELMETVVEEAHARQRAGRVTREQCVEAMEQAIVAYDSGLEIYHPRRIAAAALDAAIASGYVVRPK
jgi:hypothetical protein